MRIAGELLLLLPCSRTAGLVSNEYVAALQKLLKHLENYRHLS
jgi:hypothetical protein